MGVTVRTAAIGVYNTYPEGRLPCPMQYVSIQGREYVGRPMLERALVIQEALHGPNHPDAIAIRDVLNSE